MTSASPDGRSLLARIPEEWRGPTISIATTLRAAGYRAWVVGGGVRDLILGRPIKDIDLVSAARPDVVEKLFEKTVAVGKSFGIVVVVMDGRELEVATFRRERGYSDRRRPDEIEFADSPDVDARRRDFTCNALFLDPLDGEIADPTGGLADLEAGALRAVGDPADRFREDGLRLLRMARFAAGFGLEPAPDLLAAARAERGSIVGVSPERVLDELTKILRGGSASRALALLEAAGVAEGCLPGWVAAEASQRSAVLADLERRELPTHTTVDRGLVPILGPWPLFDVEAEAMDEVIVDRLTELRASRELRQSCRARYLLAREIIRGAARLTAPDAASGVDELSVEERGRLAELARDPAFADALGLASAAAATAGTPGVAVAQVEGFADRLRRSDEGAPDAPFHIDAKSLIDAGVHPGPELGGALRRMQHAALGGAFDDRDGALAWFRANVR